MTCLEHSGIEKSIENIDRRLGEHDKEILSAHVRIDGIKNWVIAGMSSLIGQLIIMILGIVLAYFKLH